MSAEDLFAEYFNPLGAGAIHFRRSLRPCSTKADRPSFSDPAAEANPALLHNAAVPLGGHNPRLFALPEINPAAPPPSYCHGPPPPPVARAGSSGGESDSGSNEVGAAGGWSAKQVKKEATTPPLPKPKRTRNRKPSSCELSSVAGAISMS